MRHICLYIGVKIFSAGGRAGPPEVVQEALADLKTITYNSTMNCRIIQNGKKPKKTMKSRAPPPKTAPLFLFNHKLFPQRSNSPSYTADHHFRIPAHHAHDLFHIQTNSSHGQFSHCSNSLCQPRPPLPAHCILALPRPLCMNITYLHFCLSLPLLFLRIYFLPLYPS